MNIKLQKSNIDIAKEVDKQETLRGGLNEYVSPSPQLKKIHTITVDDEPETCLLKEQQPHITSVRKVIEVPEVQVKKVTSEDVDPLAYTDDSNIRIPTMEKSAYESPPRKVFKLKDMAVVFSP